MSTTDDRNPKSDENGDEEKIGCGNPPRHSRFKPGQSGNRKGRPKGAKGRKGTVEKIASEVHRVIEGGRPSRRTTLELVILTVRELALKGDVRAHDELHRILKKFRPQELDQSAGYIIAPEQLPLAEWEKLALEVQAKQEGRP